MEEGINSGPYSILLDVNLKGRSFDHTTDEMVIKLIELTDGGNLGDKFSDHDFRKNDMDLKEKLKDREEMNKKKRSAAGKSSSKKHANVIQKNDDSFLVEDEKEEVDNSGEKKIMNSFSEEDASKINKRGLNSIKKEKPQFESTIDFLSETDEPQNRRKSSKNEELNNPAERSIEDRRRNLEKLMKKKK